MQHASPNWKRPSACLLGMALKMISPVSRDEQCVPLLQHVLSESHASRGFIGDKAKESRMQAYDSNGGALGHASWSDTRWHC